jgi:hypothetical protein
LPRLGKNPTAVEFFPTLVLDFDPTEDLSADEPFTTAYFSLGGIFYVSTPRNLCLI